MNNCNSSNSGNGVNSGNSVNNCNSGYNGNLGKNYITGRVHSIETLGGVDGPGLRMIVFLQGCALRCDYCHNPDTWDMGGGKLMTSGELFRKALRYRSYFGKNGGVTLSGGEPLLQPEFAAELFGKLRAAGISTALDTAGVAVTEKVRELLALTDIVLLDIKATDEESFRQLTGGSLKTAMEFLKAASDAGCRLWIRHVVVPGLNDTDEDVQRLITLIDTAEADKKCGNAGIVAERVELLPYHSLGKGKYERLGLKYKLEGVPELEADKLKMLQGCCDMNEKQIDLSCR
ncbi:MAG: pyruvate formate lyase-activating protein [Clostridiales bacterium]|nr:pyruvate formate lyase-activating protein [Clostridiales bacterium]